MNGCHATPNKSRAFVRSAKALTGTSRAKTKSPEYQGMLSWRSEGYDDLAIVDGDYSCALSMPNIDLDMGHISVYFRHSDLLARNCVRGGCEAQHFNFRFSA